jgi:hypothetical protein
MPGVEVFRFSAGGGSDFGSQGRETQNLMPEKLKPQTLVLGT